MNSHTFQLIIVVLFTLTCQQSSGLSAKNKKLLAEIAVCVVGGRADLSAFASKNIFPTNSAPKQQPALDYLDDILLRKKHDIQRVRDSTNSKLNTDQFDDYFEQYLHDKIKFDTQRKNLKVPTEDPSNFMNAHDWMIKNEYPNQLKHRHFLDGLSQEPNLDMIKYNQILNEAPHVYDMNSGDYYRHYGSREIHAEQGLNQILHNSKKVYNPTARNNPRPLTIREKIQLQYDIMNPKYNDIKLDLENYNSKLKAKVYNIDTNEHYDLIQDKYSLKPKQSKSKIKNQKTKTKIKTPSKSKIKNQKTKTKIKTPSKGVSKVDKQQFAKQMKIQNLKQQLKFSTGLSVGMSAVVNVNLLLQGQFMEYFSTIAWDTGVAAVITSCEVGLEETVFESVSPGIGVAIFTVIDVAKASQTGDWERVALNFGLNLGSTGGALVGGTYGAAAGAAVGSAVPIVGTAIGGVVGGIFGAVSGAIAVRGGLSIVTPLGKMTVTEANKMKKELAQKLNPGLEEFGLKLDEKKDLNEILDLLKNENVPVVATEDFVKAKDVSYAQVAKMHGDDFLQRLLGEAKLLSADDIGEGLQELKKALGC